MQFLCKYLGGSHSYGLNTPTSDLDHRGVFIDTEIKNLIGLDVNKQRPKQTQTQEVDEVFSEFRHALSLLRSGNTQIIEALYNEEWLEITPQWKKVQEYRSQLVDSERLFSCLHGYMESELRLALGERTGKLGSKRFAQLAKYGYSPKNVVQMVRLAWAGCTYFQTGVFPVNVRKHDSELADELMKIKTQPETFDKTQIKELFNLWDTKLEVDFECRKVTTTFDESLAHELCLRIYGPKILKIYNETVFRKDSK